MADETRIVAIQYDAMTKKAEKELQNFIKANEDTAKSTAKVKSGTDDLSGSLDVLASQLGPVGTGITGFSRGVKNLTAGFKTLRGAIVATGVGALVIALTTVATFLTQSAEGQEKLNKVVKGAETIFNVFKDLVIELGGALFNAFENPKEAISSLLEAVKTNVINRFKALPLLAQAVGKSLKAAFELDLDGVKEGLEDAATAAIQFSSGLDAEQQAAALQGIKGIIEEVNTELEKSNRLSDRENQLRRQRIAFTVRESELRREAATAEREAADRSKTFEERIAAQQRAIEAELKLQEEQNAIRQTEIDILRERQALGVNTLEDNEQLAALIAQQNDAFTQQEARIRGLEEKEQSLRAERQAAIDSEIAEQERVQAEKDRLREEELEKERRAAAEKERIAKEEADAAVAFEKFKAEATLDTTQGLANALGSLLGEESAAGKSAAIADAIINSYKGATAALDLPFPASLLAFATVLAQGLGAVKNIIATPEPDTTISLTAATGGRLPAKTGGMITGRSHSMGGVKFRVGGYAAEAEGGEYIVNRRATARFFPVLDAINRTGKYEQGGLLFQNGGVTPAVLNNLQSGLESAIRNAPPVLVLEDLDIAQNRVNTIDDLAKL